MEKLKIMKTIVKNKKIKKITRNEQLEQKDQIVKKMGNC